MNKLQIFNKIKYDKILHKHVHIHAHAHIHTTLDIRSSVFCHQGGCVITVLHIRSKASVKDYADYLGKKT